MLCKQPRPAGQLPMAIGRMCGYHKTFPMNYLNQMSNSSVDALANPPKQE